MAARGGDLHHVLQIEPEEIVFTNVKINQAYTKCVRITNPSAHALTFAVRAGAADRYFVTPSHSIRLNGGASTLVEIRLRLTRALHPKRVGTAQKDVFHVQGDMFNQKFFAHYYVAGVTPPPHVETAATATASTSVNQPTQVDSESLPIIPSAASKPVDLQDMLQQRNDECHRLQRRLQAALTQLKLAELTDQTGDDIEDVIEEMQLDEARDTQRDEFNRLVFGTAGDSDSEVDPLEPASVVNLCRQRTRLRRVIRALRTRVVQAEQALSMSNTEVQRQATALQWWAGMQTQIDTAYPDLTRMLQNAMENERAENDHQNAKVLLILQQKDAEIADLKQQLAESQRIAAAAKAASTEWHSRYQSGESEAQRAVADAHRWEDLANTLEEQRRQAVNALNDAHLHAATPSMEEQRKSHELIQTLKRELEQLRQQSAEQRDQLDTLLHSAPSQASSSAAPDLRMQRELDTLRETCAELERELKRKREEESDAHQRAVTAEALARSLETQLLALGDDASQMNSGSSESTSTSVDLNARATQSTIAAATAATATEVVSPQDRRVQAAERASLMAARRIAQLSADLRVARAESKDERLRAAAALSASKSAEQAQSVAEREAAELRSQLADVRRLSRAESKSIHSEEKDALNAAEKKWAARVEAAEARAAAAERKVAIEHTMRSISVEPNSGGDDIDSLKQNVTRLSALLASNEIAAAQQRVRIHQLEQQQRVWRLKMNGRLDAAKEQAKHFQREANALSAAAESRAESTADTIAQLREALLRLSSANAAAESDSSVLQGASITVDQWLQVCAELATERARADSAEQHMKELQLSSQDHHEDADEGPQVSDDSIPESEQDKIDPNAAVASTEDASLHRDALLLRMAERVDSLERELKRWQNRAAHVAAAPSEQRSPALAAAAWLNNQSDKTAESDPMTSPERWLGNLLLERDELTLRVGRARRRYRLIHHELRSQRSRVADLEKSLAQAQLAMPLERAERETRHSDELAACRQREATLQRQVTAVHESLEMAKVQLVNAEEHGMQLEQECEKLRAEAILAVDQRRAAERRLEEGAARAEVQCERLQSQVTAREQQLAVLVDTVDALQAGDGQAATAALQLDLSVTGVAQDFEKLQKHCQMTERALLVARAQLATEDVERKARMESEARLQQSFEAALMRADQSARELDTAAHARRQLEQRCRDIDAERQNAMAELDALRRSFKELENQNTELTARAHSSFLVASHWRHRADATAASLHALQRKYVSERAEEQSMLNQSEMEINTTFFSSELSFPSRLPVEHEQTTSADVNEEGADSQKDSDSDSESENFKTLKPKRAIHKPISADDQADETEIEDARCYAPSAASLVRALAGEVLPERNALVAELARVRLTLVESLERIAETNQSLLPHLTLLRSFTESLIAMTLEQDTALSLSRRAARVQRQARLRAESQLRQANGLVTVLHFERMRWQRCAQRVEQAAEAENAANELRWRDKYQQIDRARQQAESAKVEAELNAAAAANSERAIRQALAHAQVQLQHSQQDAAASLLQKPAATAADDEAQQWERREAALLAFVEDELQAHWQSHGLIDNTDQISVLMSEVKRLSAALAVARVREEFHSQKLSNALEDARQLEQTTSHARAERAAALRRTFAAEHDVVRLMAETEEYRARIIELEKLGTSKPAAQLSINEDAVKLRSELNSWRARAQQAESSRDELAATLQELPGQFAREQLKATEAVRKEFEAELTVLRQQEAVRARRWAHRAQGAEMDKATQGVLTLPPSQPATSSALLELDQVRVREANSLVAAARLTAADAERRATDAMSRCAAAELAAKETQEALQTRDQALLRLTGELNKLETTPARWPLSGEPSDSKSTQALAARLSLAHLRLADLERQVRVSARAEAKIRAQVAERDVRIADLKRHCSKNHVTVQRRQDMFPALKSETNTDTLSQAHTLATGLNMIEAPVVSQLLKSAGMPTQIPNDDWWSTLALPEAQIAELVKCTDANTMRYALAMSCVQLNRANAAIVYLKSQPVRSESNSSKLNASTQHSVDDVEALQIRLSSVKNELISACTAERRARTALRSIANALSSNELGKMALVISGRGDSQEYSIKELVASTLAHPVTLPDVLQLDADEDSEEADQRALQAMQNKFLSPVNASEPIKHTCGIDEVGGDEEPSDQDWRSRIESLKLQVRAQRLLLERLGWDNSADYSRKGSAAKRQAEATVRERWANELKAAGAESAAQALLGKKTDATAPIWQPLVLQLQANQEELNTLRRRLVTAQTAQREALELHEHTANALEKSKIEAAKLQRALARRGADRLDAELHHEIAQSSALRDSVEDFRSVQDDEKARAEVDALGGGGIFTFAATGKDVEADGTINTDPQSLLMAEKARHAQQLAAMRSLWQRWKNLPESLDARELRDDWVKLHENVVQAHVVVSQLREKVAVARRNEQQAKAEAAAAALRSKNDWTAAEQARVETERVGRELASTVSRLTSMTQDFSKLGEDNQNLQAELQRSRDSISRQEALIKQLNSRITADADARAVVESKIVSLSQVIDNLKGRNDQVEQRAAKAEQLCLDANEARLKEHVDASNKIAELEQRILQASQNVQVKQPDEVGSNVSAVMADSSFHSKSSAPASLSQSLSLSFSIEELPRTSINLPKKSADRPPVEPSSEIHSAETGVFEQVEQRLRDSTARIDLRQAQIETEQAIRDAKAAAAESIKAAQAEARAAAEVEISENQARARVAYQALEKRVQEEQSKAEAAALKEQQQRQRCESSDMATSALLIELQRHQAASEHLTNVYQQHVKLLQTRLRELLTSNRNHPIEKNAPEDGDQTHQNEVHPDVERWSTLIVELEQSKAECLALSTQLKSIQDKAAANQAVTLAALAEAPLLRVDHVLNPQPKAASPIKQPLSQDDDLCVVDFDSNSDSDDEHEPNHADSDIVSAKPAKATGKRTKKPSRIQSKQATAVTKVYLAKSKNATVAAKQSRNPVKASAAVIRIPVASQPALTDANHSFESDGAPSESGCEPERQESESITQTGHALLRSELTHVFAVGAPLHSNSDTSALAVSHVLALLRARLASAELQQAAHVHECETVEERRRLVVDSARQRVRQEKQLRLEAEAAVAEAEDECERWRQGSEVAVVRKLNEELEKAKQRIDELKQKSEEAKQKVEDAKAEVAKSKVAMERKTVLLTHIRAQYDELKASSAAAATHHSETASQLANLQKAVASKDRLLLEARERLNAVSEREAAQEAQAATALKKQTLATKIAEDRLRSLQMDCGKADTRIKELELMLRESKSASNSTTSSAKATPVLAPIAEHSTENEIASRKLSLSTLEASHSSTLAKPSTEINATQNPVPIEQKSDASAVNALTDANKALEKQVSSLQNNVARLKTDLERKETALSACRARVTAADAELESLKTFKQKSEETMETRQRTFKSREKALLAELAMAHRRGALLCSALKSAGAQQLMAMHRMQTHQKSKHSSSLRDSKVQSLMAELDSLSIHSSFLTAEPQVAYSFVPNASSLKKSSNSSTLRKSADGLASMLHSGCNVCSVAGQAAAAPNPSDASTCRCCALDGGRRRHAAQTEGSAQSADNVDVAELNWRDREARDRMRDAERENSLLMRAFPIDNPADATAPPGASPAIRAALEDWLRACDESNSPEAAHTMFQSLVQLLRMRQKCERQLMDADFALRLDSELKAKADHLRTSFEAELRPTRESAAAATAAKDSEIIALTDAVKRYEQFAIHIKETLTMQQERHQQQLDHYRRRCEEMETMLKSTR